MKLDKTLEIGIPNLFLQYFQEEVQLLPVRVPGMVPTLKSTIQCRNKQQNRFLWPCGNQQTLYSRVLFSVVCFTFIFD